MVKTADEKMPRVRPAEGKLVPWNPIEDLMALNNRANELFGRGWGYAPLARLIPGEIGVYEPMVDIFQTAENIEFFVALPGFTPEEITVEALPDGLIIAGERKAMYEVPKEKTVEGWAGTTATFRVTYPLAVEIDPTKVVATFKNGVLHLVLPMVTATTAKITPVKVIAN